MNDLSHIEKTLQSLVAIQTVSGDTVAVQSLIDFVKESLQDYPLHIREFNDDGYPILLLTTRPTLKPKTLLVAHGDVVHADDKLYNLCSDSKKLYGRGVWDMKFAIAGYIELVRSLGKRVSKYDFGILITSDEETRNKNARFVIEQGILPKNIILLDGSSDWRLESGAKGAWTVKISVDGITAHGARPWEGKSASMELLDALSVIRSWFPKESPEGRTLNISLMQAGNAVNQLPENATAALDMRFPSNKERDIIKDKLLPFLKDRSISWRETANFPAFQHDMKNTYTTSFMKSIARITGSIKLASMSYGNSDAAYFAQANIPCIVTRPNGGGHHSDDEWIDRSSLEQLVPILIDYLDSLAKP